MKMRAFTFSFALFLVSCVTNPETGSQAIIVTSSEQEAALGDRAFQEILSKERLSTNRRWQGILERVGKRIAEASRVDGFNWEFRLIESKTQNAFCLPGGKVAFYTGIFPAAVNEAGLAAIMGHEVAHATARHAGQRITLAFGTEIAFEGLNAILDGKLKDRPLLFAALGAGTMLGVSLPFSRAQESEADKIGLIYMARAGYDPHQAPAFWEKFGAASSQMPKFLSSHPPSDERMRALGEQVESVLGTYQSSPKYGTGEVL
ncbi:M48 family metallopeptidase [bacterium]|nr:M48 family metallopeptidase [bacterium]